MHPVLFQIGPLTIYSWGVMVALGFAVGIVVAVLRAQKEGFPPETVVDLSMYILLSAIIGARLFYVIQFWNEFKNNVWSVFAVWEGGMVFYGGLIAALLVLLWQVKRKKIDLLKILDIAAPSTAIGYSIGRLGCFLRGCCFGVESNLLPDFRHPTQLYSSIAGLLIFAVLIYIREKKKYDGQVFVWAIISYSIYRFSIEFVRYSPVYYLGLTPSQWIAGFTFILAVGSIIYWKGVRVKG
jgi:phosphatidylglycerol:prolipoprotein diacylglycerol transferase